MTRKLNYFHTLLPNKQSNSPVWTCCKDTKHPSHWYVTKLLIWKCHLYIIKTYNDLYIIRHVWYYFFFFLRGSFLKRLVIMIFVHFFMNENWDTMQSQQLTITVLKKGQWDYSHIFLFRRRIPAKWGSWQTSLSQWQKHFDGKPPASKAMQFPIHCLWMAGTHIWIALL